METEYQWDFFISHASEDKDEIARPLAELLNLIGFKVWYDEFILKVGDNLARSLDKGLKSSRFGIVILSPTFFNKYWTNRELDGLITLDSILQKDRILPVAHQVSHTDIANFSLPLANTIHIPSSIGLENIIRKLLSSVEDRMDMPEGIPKPASDFIMRHEFYSELRKIREFEGELDYSEANIGYDVLVTFGQNTRRTVKGILSSDVILDIVRKLLIEELERPKDKPFTPFEVALYGLALFQKGHSKEQTEKLRTVIQQSDEYREKHPDSTISNNPPIRLNRIQMGKELATILSQALDISSDFDEPTTEEEADLLSTFVKFISEWDEWIEYDLVQGTMTLSHMINNLEKCSYFVYSALKQDDIHSFYPSLTKTKGTLDNWKRAYIIICREKVRFVMINP